jgi:hypothetical protein
MVSDPRQEQVQLRDRIPIELASFEDPSEVIETARQLLRGRRAYKSCLEVETRLPGGPKQLTGITT